MNLINKTDINKNILQNVENIEFIIIDIECDLCLNENLFDN